MTLAFPLNLRLADQQALPGAFSLGPVPGLGDVTASNILSRTVSLTQQGSGITEAAFSFSGDAAGEGLPEGSSYSVRGTASSTAGWSPPLSCGSRLCNHCATAACDGGWYKSRL